MPEPCHPIALFNGPIFTSDGLYRVEEISVDAARSLVRQCGFVSAIGHEAAAGVLSELLNIDAPMNRIQFHQAAGQKAIALKLHQRPPEGTILDHNEMAHVGYSMKLIERLE